MKGLSGRPVGAVAGVRLLGLLAVGSYAWVVAGLDHFAGPALAGVLVPGVLVAGLGWRRRRPPPAEAVRHRAGVLPWTCVLAAVVALELWAYAHPRREAYPTLSSLADPALKARPVAAILFVAWLALGWHLARR